MILSNAVHYAANQAHHAVGYNTVYHFLPGIDVKYDLLDKGPERIHDNQYRSQVEAEYGNLIDPTKENLTKNQLFWKMEEVFRRISVYEDSVLVRRVEGNKGYTQATTATVKVGWISLWRSTRRATSIISSTPQVKNLCLMRGRWGSDGHSNTACG